jgi:hypothetical protein
MSLGKGGCEMHNCEDNIMVIDKEKNGTVIMECSICHRRFKLIPLTTE